MKDESHHLKHVQKKVLRSARKKTLERGNKSNYSTKQRGTLPRVEAFKVYDEVIPSDQQIPRAPNRGTYH